MRRRTLEEKRHILKELSDWKEQGGKVKGFALQKGIERRILYTWMEQIAEERQGKKQDDRGIRRQQFVQLPGSEDTAGKQGYRSSVAIQIISSGVRAELPRGCTKEDIDVVIRSMRGGA